MSIITALFDKSVHSYADAFKATDKTSDAMKEAIKDWFDLYYKKEPTEDEDTCQQIPHTKTVFSEYTASAIKEDEFIADVLTTLDTEKETAVELALVGGECLLKPVPLVREKSWYWTVIMRPNILVFARDPKGRMTDIGTAEHTTYGNDYYTLLERRTVDENGYLTIQNRLYKSMSQNGIGTPVSLKTLPQYAELPDTYTFQKPIWSVGLVTVKTPFANCVDGSHDGVSVYAAVVGLIHNINRNEAQLNGEFERGESKVFVSEDLLKRKKDGRKVIDDHVFVGLNDDPETTGITIFSPDLRVDEFETRKQEYLRNVESIIGLKRGLLSEVEAQERTAKEITSSEGDYNLTIIGFQKMWAKAVKEAVKLCGILGQLYGITGAHEVQDDEVSIDWGNGILYDEDKTWADYLDMVARGLLKPEIALGKRFGMPTETPEDLAAIREKYMPNAEKLAEDEGDE